MAERPLRISTVRNAGKSWPAEGRGPATQLTEYVLQANFSIPLIGVLCLEEENWVERTEVSGRRSQRLTLIVRELEFPDVLHQNERLVQYVLSILRGQHG